MRTYNQPHAYYRGVDLHAIVRKRREVSEASPQTVTVGRCVSEGGRTPESCSAPPRL